MEMPFISTLPRLIDANRYPAGCSALFVGHSASAPPQDGHSSSQQPTDETAATQIDAECNDKLGRHNKDRAQ